MIYIFPATLAHAADAAEQSGGIGSLVNFIPLVIMFVIFYFLLIRPQQKRTKEHKKMLSEVQKGDNVITTGGIHGKIISVADDAIMVEIADNVRVKVSRDAVVMRKT